MRVLAITNLYPSDSSPGSGVFIEQQIQALRSQGTEVDVMFVDRRREGPWIYYRMGPHLQETLVKFRPDLVHVMYGGVMADQVTAKRGLPPAIVTLHGSDLLGENLSGLARKIVSRYGVHCSRKAACRARGVIVVARHLIDALGRRVDTRKIRVIPCGIDLERFKPLDRHSCQEQLGWRADHFHVLFANSSGDPVKQPELAQAAVDQLRQRRGEVRFHLLSGIPNKEVPVWLNAGDALLLTSKQEGSPTVVKEALACGLPVISVPVGDVAEQIAEINGCHLAEPRPADLAQKLEFVFQERRRVDCREKLQAISDQAIGTRIEKFYAEVLNNYAASEAKPARAEVWTKKVGMVSSS